MNDRRATKESSVATLLVVDDNPDNIAPLGDLLQADCRVLAATSGRHG
ncbi:MAG: hypothetical protein NTY05_11880 [Rhodocyclales bacterium]|nr:hypothetical protein [Rhodocyclales bacterium]